MQYGITLLMNNTCNKRCKYCYEHNTGDSVMTISQIDYIFKRLWNLPGFNKDVLFFGGEPTLNLNVIRECVSKYKDLHYAIITNGYFLMESDYSDYEFLKNVSVNISLEGTSRSFKELRGDDNLFSYLEKIKRLVDLGWRNIVVNISVNGLLLQDLDEFVRVCMFLRNNNIGIHFYSLNGEDFFTSSAEYLEFLISVGKKSNWILRRIVGEPENADTVFLCALENSMTFDGNLCLVDCARNKSNPIKLTDLNDNDLLLEFATRVSNTHISLFSACRDCEVPVGNCTRSCPAFINEMLDIKNYNKLDASCEKEIIKNRIRTGKLIIDEETIGIPDTINHLELILTNGCNMNCSYCFEHKSGHVNVMSEETLHNALELIKSKITCDHLDITLFGGEPLISSTLPIRLKLLKYIKSSNVKINISIITNLFNITADDLNWIVDLKKVCNQLNVQVSLDSIKDVNDKYRVDTFGDGTFDRVVDNLKKLSKSIGSEHITINSVLTTIEHVRHLNKWMMCLDTLYEYFNSVQYNFDQCKIIYNIDEWNDALNETVLTIYSDYIKGDLSLKVVKPFLEYSERSINANSSGCDALIHSVTIDSDGWIIPCHFDINDSSKHIYNVNTKLCGDNYRNVILSYMSHDSYLCSICDISTDCRRCKVAGLNINGGIPRYTCEIYSNFYSIKEKIIGDQFRLFNNVELCDFKNDLEYLQQIHKDNVDGLDIEKVVENMIMIYNQRRRV